MKKAVKKMAALAMAAVMVCGAAVPAEAATHAPGCGATGRTQVCDAYKRTTTDRHRLHTNVYCNITGYIYTHYYKCSGCGVKVANGNEKICYRIHTICPRENYLCK